MTDETLKNCPFCGSIAHILESANGTVVIDHLDYRYQVWCPSCEVGQWGFSHKKQVIDDWNKRTNKDGLDQARAQIAKLKDDYSVQMHPLENMRAAFFEALDVLDCRIQELITKEGE